MIKSQNIKKIYSGIYEIMKLLIALGLLLEMQEQQKKKKAEAVAVN